MSAPSAPRPALTPEREEDLRPIVLRVHCFDEGRDWWTAIPAFQLSPNFAANPETRGRWKLNHIGTGKAVVILGSLKRVREAAAELEAVADFDFSDEDGEGKNAESKSPAAIELVSRLRTEMANLEEALMAEEEDSYE